jgi:hypothetical protein
MLILITTLGRATKQKALAQIPESFHDRVRIFTKQSELAELQANLPATITAEILPDDTDGIAQTRQRAIDAIPKGKVWVIDDLCVFKKRTITPERIVYSPLTEQEFADLYQRVDALLDSYIQVGISAHNGNNRVLEPLKPIGRAYSTYGLRTDMMKRADVRFDSMYEQDKECKFMEDFYITLDALTKGYPNVIIYDYCFTYAHNTAGGNSTNRTLERHARSAQMLAKRFPGLVKLVQKEGKWGTQEMDSRTEIQAQWKKAFEQSKRKRSRR